MLFLFEKLKFKIKKKVIDKKTHVG